MRHSFAVVVAPRSPDRCEASAPGPPSLNCTSRPVLAALLVALASFSTARAQFCPFPVAPCHLKGDVNCDGRDPGHCTVYDIDGAVYGDCQPDAAIDDLWTFYDGDFNGVADACDPDDIVLMTPDGIGDGNYNNPVCDRWYKDTVHTAFCLYFSDPVTINYACGSLNNAILKSTDLVRGDVAQISVGASSVNLGPVTCLAENQPSSFSVIDPAVPSSRKIFFYVIRWGDGSEYPYGYSNCKALTVQAGNGDCNP